jgi:hypothetical protein
MFTFMLAMLCGGPPWLFAVAMMCDTALIVTLIAKGVLH